MKWSVDGSRRSPSAPMVINVKRLLDLEEVAEPVLYDLFKVGIF